MTTVEGVRSRVAEQALADYMEVPVEQRWGLWLSTDIDHRLRRELMAAARREMGTPFGMFRDDPEGFVHIVLRRFPWSKQRAQLRSVRDHRRTAVHAAHDTGKTKTASWCACWWISVHPLGEAKVVSTAPTGFQVKGLLWQELNVEHERGGLPGRMLLTEWWEGSKLLGFGRKPSDYNEAAFQGVHERYVLVVVDEAAGIAPTLWTGVEGLLTNDDARVLAIGNPDDATSTFAQLCDDPTWRAIHVDGFDSPNFTDEPVPDDLRHYLLGRQWVEERRLSWTEDSPLWTARVRGLFPTNAADRTVPLSWVIACQDPEREWAPDQLLPVELGVDVGGGGDRTVVYERRGARAGRMWEAFTPEPEQAAEKVMEAVRACQPKRIKFDSIGVGWGIYGYVRHMLAQAGLSDAVACVPVNVSEKATEPETYYRKRDELWWNMRKLTEERAVDLSAIDDVTRGELTAPKYGTKLGKIVVESKDDLRKRIDKSPDRADALNLAFWDEVAEASSWAPSTARIPDRFS